MSKIEVITDGSTVRIIEDGQVRTMRASRGGRSMLVDGELEWYLRCADSALGSRGTTASVVSMIERGGASGTSDFDAVMLQRIGWAPEEGRSGHANVGKARRLGARWIKLTGAHQRVLVAHYLLTPRVDSKIKARCAELSGAVVLAWLTGTAETTETSKATQLEALAGELAAVRAILQPLEAELQRLDTWERRAPRWNRLRAKSRGWFIGRMRQPVEGQARPLRSAVGDLLARQSAIASAGSPERALRDLVTRCERGEVSGLIEAAQRAVEAAHKAWAKTGQQEAQEWVEAP